jgi:hypothetical protein
MTTRLTDTQVTKQQQRFEDFLKTVNLVKLGRRYHHMVANDAKNGMYTPYVYLLRVLSICAKVEGTCLHPDTCKDGVRTLAYRDIMHDAAIKTMSIWFDTYGEAYKEVIADLEACVNTDMLIYKGSKGYTPKQVIYHIKSLSEFGQQYIADFVEGCKAISFPKPKK